MNIDKINNKLGIKDIEEEEIEQSQELVEIEKTEAPVLYTENVELQAEIDQYKDERKENIDMLKEVREKTFQAFKDLSGTMQISEPKEIEAFSKLVKTFTGLAETIDDITCPEKVEIYIEPPQEKVEEDKNVTNIQNNNYFGTPQDLEKLIKETMEKDVDDK